MNDFNNIRSDSGDRDFESMAIIGARGMGKSTLMRCLGDSYMKENPELRILVHDSSESKAFGSAYRWFEITMDELLVGWEFEGSTTQKYVWRKGKRKIYTLKDWGYESPKELQERLFKEAVYAKKGLKPPAKGGKRAASLEELTAKYLFSNFRNGMLLLDEAYEWAGFSPPRWADALILKHRNHGLDIVLVYHAFTFVPKRWRTHFNKFVVFKSGDSGVDSPKYFKKLGFLGTEQLYEAYRKVNEMPYQSDKIIQPFKIVDLTVR